MDALAGMTDGQLLERFAQSREASAFEVLVRRHGAMVLRVCQRVLANRHDADDAFQATFIVLVRKGASITKLDSVGSWLHSVAYRIALKARAARKRQACEILGMDDLGTASLQSAPATAALWRELRPVLDEELNRLPEKYRAPIVLCYLEGKTNDEAAQQLGRSRGMIASQLSRARDLLRTRLTRRGMALSAGTLAGLLAVDSACAAVPATLTASTLQAVTLATAGKATAAGLVATQASTLADGALKGMAAIKLKLAAGVLVAVTVVATGAAVLLPGPEKSFRNSIGMKLTAIPVGQFLMGASADEMATFKKEQGRYGAAGFVEKEAPEGPQHKVEITKLFYLGVHTVTQDQYQKVMNENPSSFPDSPDHPVDRVSWDQAMAFCNKLSALPEEKKAGRTYRLPTEAEWEYACRAGTTTIFSCGDSLSSRQANFDGTKSFGIAETGQRIGKTVPVGSYPPNAWGLHDMHGNVWQWCLDSPRTYMADPVRDPQGPDSNNRILRGGAWREPGYFCRSTFRKPRTPDYCFNWVGFRVVCER